MSSLVNNPMPQFINPYFGNPCEDAKIYVGAPGTDALNPGNWIDVYLMQFTDETAYTKAPLPQPLLTNSAGIITFQGMPVTPWVDSAYSITIVSYDGATLYQSFYVDDPTYWLRIDLATMPTDDDPDKGWKMVAGVAPIDNPTFTGNPSAPTPPAGDNDTSIATTEFVQQAVDNALSVGILGTGEYWAGSTAPIGAFSLDGSQLSKETYPEAYALIGDTVAVENNIVPDSAAFYIPDMRSRSFRGADNGAGRADADRFKYYDDAVKNQNSTTTLPFAYTDADGSQYPMLMSPGTSGDGSSTITASNNGGPETRVKECPWLPILWVMTPEEVAAAQTTSWWATTTPPTNYHYTPETGELLGTSAASPSWKEPGVWLFPLHATYKPPISDEAGHITVFRDGEWLHDAELFRKRQDELKAAQQLREDQNAALLEKSQARKKMNDAFSAAGLPFTIEDISRLL